MRFAIENSRTQYEEDVSDAQSVSNRSPLELFAEFYEHQHGVAPDEARMGMMRRILEEVEQQ
jgi:exonuclease SbcD